MEKQHRLFNEWILQSKKLTDLKGIIQNDFDTSSKHRLTTKEDIQNMRKNFLSQYRIQINIMSKLAGEIGNFLKCQGHIEGEICPLCEDDGCSECCPCPTCGTSGYCPTCEGQGYRHWHPKSEMEVKEFCPLCEGDGCSECCPPTCGTKGVAPVCDGTCYKYPC